jgi:hypothetical protein
MRLKKETGWLLFEFSQSAKRFRAERHGQLACEMVVIRMHDSWSRFCRDLVITSAVGNTQTLGGLKIPKSSVINSRSDVIPALLTKYKKRRNEPNWYDAGECLDAAQRLAIVNFSTVSAAIGAANSPAGEMRKVRNFYAHRKWGSAQIAMATGLFSSGSWPTVFDLVAYRSAGETIIESWVKGLVSVAVTASQ